MGGVTRERTQVHVRFNYAVEVRGQFGELVLTFVSLPSVAVQCIPGQGTCELLGDFAIIASHF